MDKEQELLTWLIATAIAIFAIFVAVAIAIVQQSQQGSTRFVRKCVLSLPNPHPPIKRRPRNMQRLTNLLNSVAGVFVESFGHFNLP